MLHCPKYAEHPIPAFEGTICNDPENGLQIEPHRVVSHDIAVGQHEQMQLEQARR